MLISQMNDEEKLLWMFRVVHGAIDHHNSAISLGVEYDDSNCATSVIVYKNGNVAWTTSITNILFDYIMKDISSQQKLSEPD